MRRPKAVVGDIVQVEWYDAICLEEWTDDILDTVPLCYTLGHLIKETTKFIVVAQTHATSGAVKEWASQTLIPRGIISKITVLKEKEASK